MFFKSTLTVPKIKDLVNSSNQKYQNIYDTLSHKNTTCLYTDIDLLPNNAILTESEPNSMKDELKHFLKKQLNGTNNDIMGIDSLAGNFSAFN